MVREEVVYNGTLFVRYPDSPDSRRRLYFQPLHRQQAAKQGVQALHQEIYKAHYGPIPEGWHVHHKDEDTLNNKPDNLEALTPGQHARLHARTAPPKRAVCVVCGVPYTYRRRGVSFYCSKLCKSRALDPRRARITKTCEQCGQAYECRATFPDQRYCSDQCKAAARAQDRVCQWCGETWFSKSLNPHVRFCSAKCKDAHRYANKVGFEERGCVICGKAFRIYPSSAMQCCSRPCGEELRRRNFAARTGAHA